MHSHYEKGNYYISIPSLHNHMNTTTASLCNGIRFHTRHVLYFPQKETAEFPSAVRQVFCFSDTRAGGER